MAKTAPKAKKTVYVTKPAKGKKRADIEAALDDIYNAHGLVNQELLVDYAKPVTSPIHEYFEWDNKVAGEKYRLNQALQMIMASKFVVMLTQSKAPPLVDDGVAVRKLLPTFSGDGFKMRYEVLEEKDARAEFIELKKTQLRTWCRETIDVAELAPIRNEILKLL